jgi:uncharacterized membrane protein YfcA
MPENKKRPGHPYRKPADIPANERVKGKTFWAILFAVFGLLIGILAAGANYLVLAIATLAGGVIGFFIGMRMEKEK